MEAMSHLRPTLRGVPAGATLRARSVAHPTERFTLAGASPCALSLP